MVIHVRLTIALWEMAVELNVYILETSVDTSTAFLCHILHNDNILPKLYFLWFEVYSQQSSCTEGYLFIKETHLTVRIPSAVSNPDYSLPRCFSCFW